MPRNVQARQGLSVCACGTGGAGAALQEASAGEAGGRQGTAALQGPHWTCRVGLMIEIRHKQSGDVLRTVQADSLVGQFFEGAKLAGANLSKRDLSNTDLQRADLRDADLTGANLAGAMMAGAVIRRRDA